MITAKEMLGKLSPEEELCYCTDAEQLTVSTTPRHAVGSHDITSLVLALIDRTSKPEELAWLKELDEKSLRFIYWETARENVLRAKLETIGVKFDGDGYADGIFSAPIRTLWEVAPAYEPKRAEMAAYELVRNLIEAYG